MTSKVFKKPLLIIVVAGLLLICTQAITQFGKTGNNIGVEADNTADTLQFGKPTGEDPSNEMEKLSKWYKPNHTIRFNGFIRLFDEKETNPKLIEEKKFTFSLDSNRNCSYELGGVEVINNDDYSLTVDNNNRFVFLTKNLSTADGKQPQFFDIAKFERILKETNAEAEVTKSGEDKILTVKNIKDPTVQGYAIYYSPTDYHIRKIVLQMWQLAPLPAVPTNSLSKNDNLSNQTNPKEGSNKVDTDGNYYNLEISYSGIDSSNSSTVPTQAKYVHFTNNRVELTKEYSEYELINQSGKLNN